MRSIFRVAAVLAAATLPVVGLSASQASAGPKPKPAGKQITVTCSPNPVVEVQTSAVLVVCQVEANPTTGANHSVTISSTQLASRCPGGLNFFTFPDFVGTGGAAITLPLDNDGNATVNAFGNDCAPGSFLFTADLDAPPFSTAVTKVIVESPQQTPLGLKGFPANEVEVGDVTVAPGAVANTASEADVVFMVEAPPVYAEQSVTLTSDQLTERCGTGNFIQPILLGTVGPGYVPAGGAGLAGEVATGTLDNDGNEVFGFSGGSCAAGKSTVIADVQNGGPTYSSQYNILPPAVTI